MKKTLSLILASVMALTLLCACAKPEADVAETAKEGIIGVWSIENIETKNADDELFSQLVKVLNGYLEKAPQIEFTDDKTAKIGDAEIDYTYEDGRLSLTWHKTQTFVFDVTKSDNEMKLDYQGYLSCSLKRQ